MDLQQQATTSADAAGTKIMISATPSSVPAPNDNPTGPAPGELSVKAPVWVKTRPVEPSNEE